MLLEQQKHTVKRSAIMQRVIDKELPGRLKTKWDREHKLRDPAVIAQGPETDEDELVEAEPPVWHSMKVAEGAGLLSASAFESSVGPSAAVRLSGRSS